MSEARIDEVHRFTGLKSTLKLYQWLEDTGLGTGTRDSVTGTAASRPLWFYDHRDDRWVTKALPGRDYTAVGVKIGDPCARQALEDALKSVESEK